MRRISLFVLLLIVIATPALGQSVSSPMRGLRFLSETVADTDDAIGIEINPAGIGFLSGWSFMFYHSQFADLAGEGDGAFLAAKVFGPWSVGVGLQFLRWNLFGGNYVKMSFNNAFSIGRTFSLGFNYNLLLDRQHSNINKLGSFDVGVIYRPLNWLSIGATVYDIDVPRFENRQLNRSYDVALSFRPGDRPRFTFGVGYRFEENASVHDPYISFRVEPIKGWVLMGQAGMLIRNGNWKNVAVSIGTSFSFGLIGAGAGYHYQRLGGRNTNGFSTFFRVTNRARPSLVQPSQIFPVLAIGGAMNEFNRQGLLVSKRQTLLSVVYAINYYRRDPRVSGLVLKIFGGGFGWAQAEEIREALARFKKAGKTVVVHIDSTNTVGYFLASVADLVAINPAGGVYLTGLSTTLTFFKGLLDKIGVRAQFVRIGKYKSFPESFTRKDPTKPNKEVRNSLLDGLYNHFISTVSTARRLSPAKLNAAINDGAFLPTELKRRNLVDGVLFFDQLGLFLRRRLKREVVLRAGFPSIRKQPQHWSEPKEIALIVIDGSIVDGKSSVVPILDQRFSGAMTIKKLLAQVRSSSRIKAVVIRVDSPGGSALASDLIHREIIRTRRVKPVVVSFGNIAASGGYYLAVGANEIFASRTTITGSIGIFAGKFVFSGLFRLLGINRVSFSRGKYSRLFSIDKPLSTDERNLIKQKITHFYDIFITRVATGRKLKKSDVDKVGRGRVWLGMQAKKFGLFDHYGGIYDALMAARRLAGIGEHERVRYRILPEYSFWQRIRALFRGSSEERGKTLLSESRRALMQLLAPAVLQFQPYQPLALLPFVLEIK